MLRRFVPAISAVLCLVFALGISKAPQPPVLHLLNWSEYIDPELIKAFEAQQHCTVKLDVYEETEAMLAKLAAQGPVTPGASRYDVAIASDHAIPVLAKLGLIAKMDLTRIPNASNVGARFIHPAYDPNGEYSLPYQWGSMGIIYNRKKLGNIATSWSALFGEKRAGKFLLLDSPRDTLGCALIFGGKSVNSLVKDDVQAAGKRILLAKTDPLCVGFDGSVACAKRVITGQADLAMVYNGDAMNAIKDSKSADFEYFVPAEGSILWVDTMVLPAGGNTALAHAFVNFILDGPNGAKLSNFINYATPNTASLPLVDETARKDPRIYPPDEQLKILHYLEDVGLSTKLYDAVWTAVKAR